MAWALFTALFSMIFEIALGVIIGKKKLLSEKSVDEINNLNYTFLLPLSFFLSIYDSKSRISLGMKDLMIILVMHIVLFAASMFIASLFGKETETRGSYQQCLFRSNMILYGIAIAPAVLTSEQVAEYTLAMLVVFPIQNIGSIIAQSLYQTDCKEKLTLISVVKEVAVNPLTIAIVLGFVAQSLDFRFPDFINTTLVQVSALAAPLACVMLGTGLSLENIQKNWKKVSMMAFIKLFIYPMISVVMIMSLHFDETVAFIILLLSAAPTANTVYNFAVDSKWDVSIVANMIAFSIPLSLLSVMIWINILGKII